MKKIVLLLLFLLVKTSFSQENEENTIKISTRDFDMNVLQTATDESKTLTEGRLSVKLKATYNSKESNIKIVVAPEVDSLILDYPLNYNYFETKFSKTISDKFQQQTPKQGSLLEIFYWIVTITDGLKENVLSGELILQQGLLVSDKHHPDEKYEARELKKMDIIKEFEIAKSELNNHLQEQYDVLEYQWDGKKITPGEVIKKTIAELQENKSRFERAKRTFRSSGPAKGDTLQAFIDTSKDLVVSKRHTLVYTTNENKDTTFYYIIPNQKNYDKTVSLIDFEKKFQEKEDKKITDGYYEIEKVQFHFERGFLEKIQVSVKYGKYQKTQIFENMYPIGFSSVLNYRNFKEVRLYIRNADDHSNDAPHIYLSDVIQNYENQLDLSTKDYSPADTAFTVHPEKNPIVKLFKQKSMHILEGKTFTDVTGLNEKSPNGLVQMEFSRRFNLKTNRHQAGNANNFGVLSYMVAKVTFSKIESKLKNLPLQNEKVFENGVIVSPTYATNLDFLRYENLSIRTETNLFLWDYPEGKMTFYIDAGLKYGHTPVADSIFTMDTLGVITGKSRELDAHNFTAYPKIWVEIFAEKRYGFSAGYQLNYTGLYSNNNYKQVVSYANKGNDITSLKLNKAARLSHTLELKARFDANLKSNTGKIFAVARFNFQHLDINTFYPQILVGYAFNLFK